MIRNYLKTALRVFQRNRGYSFLNIFGLSLGIACAGLIFLWVEDELNFNAFNEKKDRLYFVRVNQVYDAYTASFYSTPGVMGPALKEDLPGIANTCRVTEDLTANLFTIGDNKVYASGRYAEASLFDMFTLPFVQGNARSVFSNLYSLVVTESTARKFFGNDSHVLSNVIGKTVRVNNQQDYVITGVLKDLPQNSSLQFEWLAPFEVFYKQSPWAQTWGNFCLNTYVELEPGAKPKSINRQLYNYIGNKQKAEKSNSHAFLFAMKDWRLYDQFDNGVQTGGGRIEYVRLFSIIAWIVLIIACINFMNLATARSEKRSREVGVRKVLGAQRKQLSFQFMMESVFMAFVAGAGAVVMMLLAMPLFNQLVGKNLALHLGNPIHLVCLPGIALLCGLIAGSYPSLYLSSFNPIFVLKGTKLKTGSAALVRKTLVVLQFSISIILIVCTVLIYLQIQHVKQRNLGFNKNNLLQMNLQGDMLQHLPSIQQDLLNTGMVTHVALTDHETIYGGNNTGDIEWPGKDPNSNILVSQRLVSPEFISTMGMHVKEGRDFRASDVLEMTDDFELVDPSQYFPVIITESMAKLLGRKTALGSIMQLPHSKKYGHYNLKVIGVLDDFVYGSMYSKSDPVVFYCMPKFTSLMYVRMKDGTSTTDALAAIGAVMKKDNPAYPFEYKFVDEQFNEMFVSEMLISRLSKVFAGLAIIISCLGLFGLAAYTAERRTREIGIRKVLGASVGGITALLSRDFLLLIGLSALIAFPLAWWAMHNWLQNYQYRISIPWWVFLLAGCMAMLIALITIGFQSVKAALSNPIKSLRTE